jgi:hypothetical protein
MKLLLFLVSIIQIILSSMGSFNVLLVDESIEKTAFKKENLPFQRDIVSPGRL